MLPALAALTLGIAAACSTPTDRAPRPTTAAATTAPTATTEPVTTTGVATTTSISTTLAPQPEHGVEPPDWLGTRILEVNEDGKAIGYPTPPELVDRKFRTEDLLPPPPDGAFAATVEPVPDDVLERSSWSPACPVGRDDLRYVTLTFWGFDRAPHTGELIVHARVADDIIEAFRRIYEARVPIEEMRVVRADEIGRPPTGDGNNTSAFVCRPTAGSTTSWSEHAFGLAVDINPFQNPYEKGGWVLPELAAAYLDRTLVREGMIFEGDAVVTAFAAIGWGWGGEFRTLVDWMHFSASGR